MPKFEVAPVPVDLSALPPFLLDTFRRIKLFLDPLSTIDESWTDWVPDLLSTGGAVGYGTGTVRVGRYKLLGPKTVAFDVNIKLGSGMTLPAGTYYITLPFTAKAGPPYYPLLALFYDSSAGIGYTGVAGPQWAGTATTHFSIHWHGTGAWTTATPVAWGGGDDIHVNGIFELA